MSDLHFYLFPEESFGRCPCAKCSGLPVLCRHCGLWTMFCPTCDVEGGELKPQKRYSSKEDAILAWGLRQLASDVLGGKDN